MEHNSKSKPLREDVEIVAAPDITKCRFDDIEQLYGYISSCTDPIVGIWDHYDQDSPALRVSSKVRYTFAVVPAEDDGYEIILLKPTVEKSIIFGNLWLLKAVFIVPVLMIYTISIGMT